MLGETLGVTIGINDGSLLGDILGVSLCMNDGSLTRCYSWHY